MLSHAERSFRQGVSVPPLEKPRKQMMNLRVKICLELSLLLQEGSKLLKNNSCCSRQPPAILLPLQLSPTHLPQTLFFFCTVLGDHFVLLYDIKLCFTKEAETLFLLGFVVIAGQQAQVLERGCTQSLLQRSYNVVWETGVESHQESRVKEKHWRKTEEWVLSPSTDMGQRGRGQDRQSQDVLLAEQEVSGDDTRAAIALCCRSDPLPLFVQCNLSDTVPHQLPTDLSWVKSAAFQ